MPMDTAVLATEPAPVEVKKPPVAEVPLPDAKSGKDLSPQERAKKWPNSPRRWKPIGGRKLMPRIGILLQLTSSGQAVDSDPRRTLEYRAKVIEGLRLGPSENRPGITEADLAAISRWLAARPRRFGSKELPVLRSESLRTIACLRGLRSVPNRTRSGVRRCSGLTIGSKRRAQASPFR